MHSSASFYCTSRIYKDFRFVYRLRPFEGLYEKISFMIWKDKNFRMGYKMNKLAILQMLVQMLCISALDLCCLDSA